MTSEIQDLTFGKTCNLISKAIGVGNNRKSTPRSYPSQWDSRQVFGHRDFGVPAKSWQDANILADNLSKILTISQ